VLDCASAISSSESEFTTTGGGRGSGGCDAYDGCNAADGTPIGADTDAGGAAAVGGSVGAKLAVIVSLTVSFAAADSVAADSPRLILTVSLSAVAVVAGVGFVTARLTNGITVGDRCFYRFGGFRSIVGRIS